MKLASKANQAPQAFFIYHCFWILKDLDNFNQKSSFNPGLECLKLSVEPFKLLNQVLCWPNAFWADYGDEDKNGDDEIDYEIWIIKNATI